MKFPLAEVLATNYSPRVLMLLVEGAVAPLDITGQKRLCKVTVLAQK